MTKVEDKKLLDKIEKLIESAGADSYVAQSFEGFKEIVESNIENDFSDSYKDMAECAATNAERARKLKRDNEKMQLALNAAQLKEKIASDERDELRAEVKRLGDVITKNQREMDEWAQERNDAIKAREKAQQEVIQLKAKLYDLMTASK